MPNPSLHSRRTVASRTPGREASPYPGAILGVAARAILAHEFARALVEPQAVAVVMVTLLAGSAIAVSGLARNYPHDEFGAANAVTLLRLSLVSVLAGALASDGFGGWGVPALAMAALGLDGIDGWLARRSGLVSRYGARSDM